MIEVIVVGEGQTEESFVRNVLAPALWGRETFLDPRLIPSSRMGRGGALRWQRVLRFLHNTLLERAGTYVTTFFDMYGLDPAFPGFDEASRLADPLLRAQTIEERVHTAVVKEAGCREDRFLPHVQPYEFEALLFSDVEALADIEREWKRHLQPLQAARNSFPSPEHINDGQDTHPSARLLATLRPRYEKVLYGPRGVQRIGLDRVRVECRHFHGWLERIERLQPLNAVE